ncbi:hypothetical protein [Nocardioides sp. R-C-SC26]|uniref:hypothetical protein n=1 Tax=Nocardioides sp. R-C-SC26 TaxID=2870414 RepID=UPI001E5B6279|nr:hypothetical protein [Nocardioides sp. R-C-SC26]
MSDSYEVYAAPGAAGAHGTIGGADASGPERWRIVIEYANRGDAKPPTKLVETDHDHATREEAMRTALQQAWEFDPPDPVMPQGRRVYQDGDGFLVVVDGAMSRFHFAVRVLRFLGESS